MTLSLSTFVTHLMMCTLFLCVSQLFLCCIRNSKRLDYSVIMAWSCCIIVCLIFPYEWAYTKTIPFSGIYTNIVQFLKIDVFLSNRLAIPVYMILAVIWLTISFSLMVRLLFRQIKYMVYVRNLPTYMYIRTKTSSGKPLQIRCAIDPLSSNLLTVGFLKPVIVFPPRLDISTIELQYIIRHEVAHVVKKDIWIKLMMEMVSIFYWCIPFIGSVKQQLANALELRADRTVVKMLTNEQKTIYLECLAKLAKCSHGVAPPISAGLTSDNAAALRSRVRAIVNDSTTTIKTRLCVLMLIFLMFSSTFIVLEPYEVPQCEDCFVINTTESFLVKGDGSGYDIYLNGTRLSQINILPSEFSSLKIYDSLKEVATLE